MKKRFSSYATHVSDREQIYQRSSCSWNNWTCLWNSGEHSNTRVCFEHNLRCYASFLAPILWPRSTSAVRKLKLCRRLLWMLSWPLIRTCMRHSWPPNWFVCSVTRVPKKLRLPTPKSPLTSFWSAFPIIRTWRRSSWEPNRWLQMIRRSGSICTKQLKQVERRTSWRPSSGREWESSRCSDRTSCTEPCTRIRMLIGNRLRVGWIDRDNTDDLLTQMHLDSACFRLFRLSSYMNPSRDPTSNCLWRRERRRTVYSRFYGINNLINPHLLQLSIDTNHLDQFVTGSSSSRSEPPEGSVRLGIAGHKLPVQHIFKGSTDLLSTVWDADGRTHKAFEGHVPVRDARVSVPLLSGLSVDISSVGAISVRVLASAEVSLWNQRSNAKAEA